MPRAFLSRPSMWHGPGKYAEAMLLQRCHLISPYFPPHRVITIMSTSLRQPSSGQGGQRSTIGTGGWCPPTDRACAGAADASPAQPDSRPGPPGTGSAYRADPQSGRVAYERTWKGSRRPGGRTRRRAGRGGGRLQPASRLTGVGVASNENTGGLLSTKVHQNRCQHVKGGDRPPRGNGHARLGRLPSRAVR